MVELEQAAFMHRSTQALVGDSASEDGAGSTVSEHRSVGSLAYVVSVGEYVEASPSTTECGGAALPQSWLRLSNGTPPQLEPYIDDPAGLKEFVESVLSSVRQVREEEAQTELIDLYFEVGRPVAYALVRGLDDPITMKAVCRTLGAEGFTKLLTVEQATLAVDRDRAIRTQLRGEPGPDSTSATS